MPDDVRTLASHFREKEENFNQRLPADHWIVLRLDGRGFSELTERHFVKPFDPSFHALMESTASTVLRDFQGSCAYTGSDEISLVLPPNWSFFDRRMEKIISLSASIASVAFALTGNISVQFDSRVSTFSTAEEVCNYFLWRQMDVERCALHTLCYWTLRQEGKSARKASTILKAVGRDEQLALLDARSVTFTESWQRSGVGLYWQQYEKIGFDPLRQQDVLAIRKKVAVEKEIPRSSEYAMWVLDKLS